MARTNFPLCIQFQRFLISESEKSRVQRHIFCLPSISSFNIVHSHVYNMMMSKVDVWLHYPTGTFKKGKFTSLLLLLGHIFAPRGLLFFTTDYWGKFCINANYLFGCLHATILLFQVCKFLPVAIAVGVPLEESWEGFPGRWQLVLGIKSTVNVELRTASS